MNRGWRITCRSLVLLLGLFIIPDSLNAQSILRAPDTGSSITVEALQPNFDWDSMKIPTAGVFLTYRGARIKGRRVLVELPLAFANTEYTDTETTLGNPYLGYEIGSEDSPTFVDLGIRIPVIGKKNYTAKQIGLFSDFNQRMGAFERDSIWLKGGVNYRAISGTNFGVRGRVGILTWIPTKNTEYLDTELMMQFSLQMSKSLGAVSIWSAFGGNYWFSEKNVDFKDRLMSNLGIGASFNLGAIQPGICFSVPLDENTKEIMNSVVGIQVAFLLGS